MPAKIPIRDEDHLIAEMKPWSNLLAGASPITIQPHTRRRVVIDLQNYYCAYPQIVTSGGAGAMIRLDWQESLFDGLTAKTKGESRSDRRQIFHYALVAEGTASAICSSPTAERIASSKRSGGSAAGMCR